MVDYNGSKTAQFSTQNMSQIKNKKKDTSLAKCLKSHYLIITV